MRIKHVAITVDGNAGDERARPWHDRGSIDYELTVGDPSICPSCDCGNFGPDAVQRLGKIIIELRERCRPPERYSAVRIDLYQIDVAFLSYKTAAI